MQIAGVEISMNNPGSSRNLDTLARSLPLYATQGDRVSGSVNIAHYDFSSHSNFSNVLLFPYIMVHSYNP
jgi:hypothetical protein